MANEVNDMVTAAGMAIDSVADKFPLVDMGMFVIGVIAHIGTTAPMKNPVWRHGFTTKVLSALTSMGFATGEEIRAITHMVDHLKSQPSN